MATDPHVVNAFNRAIRHTNAPTQAARALIEAGIVESGLRNLDYGDRDSLGALQQRPSQGWKHATDPYAGALDFLAQAIPLAKSGQYKTAGALAQAVQKSAYPGRYDQHRDEALSILGGLGSPRPVTPGATGGTAPGSSSQPGATSPDLGGQGSDFAGLLSSLLAKPQTQAQAQAPMALQAPVFAAAPPLPQGFRGLLATQAPAPSAQTGVSDALGLISALGGSSPANGIPGASQTADGPQMAPAPTGGTAAPVKGSGKLATFDGKQVAGWIAPALEYARQHGWKGTVSSGYRTDAEQTRIYDSGVRPAAVPKSEGGSGSNHEGAVFPLGAIDVTNAGQLSQILRNSPYRTKLQWAGSKDPVHFSHPHGGGY